MIIALKSIKKLKNNKLFKTWIIRILINECKKIYKRKKNIYIDEVDERTIFDISNYLDEFEVINSDINFNLFLKELSADEKNLLMLYYGNGFTYEEIAKIMKTNKGAVKTRIYRIKQKIKQKVGSDKNGYAG